MSRSNNPYVVSATGLAGSYLVREGRDLRCQVGAPPLRDHLGAEPGDVVGVHPHADGVLLTSPPGDREIVTEPEVTASGQLTLTGAVLRDHLAAGDGDRVRLYEHGDALLAVVDHADPRVGGGEEA